MELGLIGLAQAGKTTLFDALTGQRTEPSGARGTHTAVVKVPDPRVERLSALYQPRQTTFAEVTFVDPVAERPDAASPGAFPEATANVLRDVDALVHVIRSFADPSVPAPPGSTTPGGDLRTLEDELILRDLALVERRLERLRKERGKPESMAELALLEPAQTHLETGRPLRDLGWSEEQRGRLRGFQFLSLKPVLVVVNVGEDDLGGRLQLPEERPGRHVLALSARIEHELSELSPAERQEYLAHLGCTDAAQGVFVRGAFRLLDLISFFTVGEDEVRAWPVRRGAPAPVAAGKIHSDLQNGFIRAEVIHYDDFVRVGSLGAARSQGLLRLEGKNYEVQDGDILHVRYA